MSKSKTAKKKGTLVYVGDRKYNYQLPIVNWGWDRELELQYISAQHQALEK